MRIHRTPLTVIAAVLIATCSSAVAQAQTPKMFNSPDDAAKALIDAASNNDASDLTAILGSASRGVLTSGNAAQDQEERREFAKLAAAKHHVEHSSINNSTAVLLVGNEDWPFPVPLIRTGQQWHFDPQSGTVEIHARQIGENELDVIEICAGYVSAQENYAQQKPSGKGVPAYAQKIMSSPGNKDGLYQPGASPELVPEGFAIADAGSRDRDKKPYHGYYFRVLREQGPNAPGGAHKYVVGNNMIGGFALIAWPAEYGVTGIHAFIVSHDDQVFEKDLGSRTGSMAPTIVKYDPDSSWTLVD